MDEQWLNNNIRKIPGGFFCPACGSKFDSDEVDTVIKKEDGYVISVRCQHCQLTVMMNVIGSGNNAGFPAFDTSSDLEAVTTDEVIEFGHRIKKFDGNFRHAFMRIDRRQ